MDVELEIKRAIYWLGGTPYLIISTDDEELRYRFVRELSKHTKVLCDYSFVGIGEYKLKEELIENDVLLLNFDEKVEEYRRNKMNNYSEAADEFGKYECRVLDKFREHFYKSGSFHTIVIVGDSDLSKKMWYLPDVKSMSVIFPLDAIKDFEKGTVKVFKKKITD